MYLAIVGLLELFLKRIETVKTIVRNQTRGILEEIEVPSKILFSAGTDTTPDTYECLTTKIYNVKSLFKALHLKKVHVSKVKNQWRTAFYFPFLYYFSFAQNSLNVDVTDAKIRSDCSSTDKVNKTMFSENPSNAKLADCLFRSICNHTKKHYHSSSETSGGTMVDNFYSYDGDAMCGQHREMQLSSPFILVGTTEEESLNARSPYHVPFPTPDLCFAESSSRSSTPCHLYNVAYLDQPVRDGVTLSVLGLSASSRVTRDSVRNRVVSLAKDPLSLKPARHFSTTTKIARDGAFFLDPTNLECVSAKLWIPTNKT